MKETTECLKFQLRGGGEKINGKLLMMMKIERGRMYLDREIVKRSTYSVKTGISAFPTDGGKQLKVKSPPKLLGRVSKADKRVESE